MSSFLHVYNCKSNIDFIKTEYLNSLSNMPNVLKHIKKILERQELFCLNFTKNYDLFNVTTNNIAERMFLSIKDDFLERNKCFNAIHLIQKVSQNYDSRCYINLVDCINSRATYFMTAFDLLIEKHLFQRISPLQLYRVQITLNLMQTCLWILLV